MNKFTIGAIAFTVGTVLGAAGAYFAVKGKYEKQAKEEIDAARSHYAKKLAKLYGGTDEKEEKEKKHDEGTSDDVPKKAKRDRHAEAPKPIDYTQFAARTDKPSLDEVAKKAADEAPYLMAAEVYNESERESVNWFYYTEDGAFIDDRDELVLDPEKTLGQIAGDMVNWKEILEDIGEDPVDHVMYVCVPKLDMDIEIDIVEDAWQKDDKEE